MTRSEYIKSVAQSYDRLCKKRDKLTKQSMSTDLSIKRSLAIDSELNWTCMYIAQDEIRLKFALGCIKVDDTEQSFNPSGFHRYPGIQKELQSLKFD